MSEQFAYLKQLPAEPGNLMRGLQMIQAQEGFVSDAAIQTLCSHFHRTTADVDAILNFYPQFKRIRPGNVQICVCNGAACHAKNAQLLHWIHELTAGETKFSVEKVDCLGRCSQAPAVSINGRIYGKLDKSRLCRILNKKEI